MANKFPKVKLAAAQVAPVFLDREATVKKTCEIIEEAGENGANIIGFPEAFIPTFPYWVFFETPLEARKKFVKLFKNAVVIPSKATDQICNVARKANIYAVVGINEREPNSMGTLYNTQLFIDNKGNIMGKHRKLMPTYAERLVHGQGDGSTLKVFETEYGGLGGLICGEHANSLAKFALLAMGERIHVASWPAYARGVLIDPIESVFFRIRQFAHEGKIFIISASNCFSPDFKEDLFENDEQKEKVSGGGNSAIIGPMGDILARASPDKEEIIYAEVDFEDVILGKMGCDVVGHYNRFDVLSINVNDEKLTPMRRVYRKTELLEEERLLTYLSEEKLKLFIEKTRSEGKGLPEALEEMIDRYLDTGS